MNFVEALKVAEAVFETYKYDQPKWWKRMDGTPILNDVAVRMAEAFCEKENEQVVASKPRCFSGDKCECHNFCGDDMWKVAQLGPQQGEQSENK